jgi:hypothetical protein
LGVAPLIDTWGLLDTRRPGRKTRDGERPRISTIYKSEYGMTGETSMYLTGTGLVRGYTMIYNDIHGRRDIHCVDTTYDAIPYDPEAY